MNVYSFWSSQSMGLLARSRPSPDVLLSTTASKGNSWPCILNAQISPAGRQNERASILRTARLHTELRLDQTYTPKSPRPFPSTQIIVKPEAAFREPAELVPFWDGNNRISPIQCSWQKKHGDGEGSHHAGELAVHPSLPVFLAGFLPALCPV